MNYLSRGGGLNSFATIIQAVMYEAGFWTPGVFPMWGIPRAKGLSHEPATNAFVLLVPVMISLFCVSSGKYRLKAKSLLLHITAFIVCFSAGAIPILLAALMIYLAVSGKAVRSVRQKFTVKIAVILAVTAALFAVYSVDITALAGLTQKFSAIFSDYTEGTNASGRGSDVSMLQDMAGNSFMAGVGAFNSLAVFEGASLTNTYIIFFCELGFVGFIVFVAAAVLFARNYAVRLKAVRHRKYYANVLAYSALIPVMIAWLRVFFFHQIWVVMALAYIREGVKNGGNRYSHGSIQR